MKLLPNILLVVVVFFGTTPARCAGATLLTFDELPTPQVLPGLNYTTIPSGYGNLLWNNFGVLNGIIRPANEGYHAGTVSPDNVAFNLYGDPATISFGAGLFNLDAAYLTAALNLDTILDIQVQGFAGTTLLYNNTYSVNRSAPSLINFGYVGVDRVTFISSPAQQFAMDNLTVTIPEPSTIGLMILNAAGFGLSGFRKILKRGSGGTN